MVAVSSVSRDLLDVALTENSNIDKNKDGDSYTLEQMRKNIITCVQITDEKEAVLKRINNMLEEEGYIFKSEKINQNIKIPGSVFFFQISVPKAPNVFYARLFNK